MKKTRSIRALLSRAVEEGYTVAQIIIIFAVIAFHVACVLPGFLSFRKRSHT